MRMCDISKNQFPAYSWFSRPARVSRSTRPTPGALQDQPLPSSFEIFARPYFSFQYLALTFRQHCSGRDAFEWPAGAVPEMGAPEEVKETFGNISSHARARWRAC